MDKKTEKLILNSLRRSTLAWGSRKDCLNESRKKIKVGVHKNGKDKLVFHYHCANCKKWFRDFEVEVDHIDEVGSFNGDFNAYIERLFCEQDNLQILCIPCHAEKTKGFVARKAFKRKF